MAATIESGFEIPGERLSTGVRLLFFFVALAHHPSPPDVVLIEEPENGVHPRRLADIVALLRRLTTGELSGKAVQGHLDHAFTLPARSRQGASGSGDRVPP
ncbi:MAG TPA: AAA family ATPase [Vicinamibacteria bacterium]|nr:AAA family ATPase [Vicinamibacteria bacterium]